MKVLFVNADDTSRHVSSANTAIYPNLGLLTLMSALTIKIGRDKLGYIDGTVFGNDAIHKYINDYSGELSVICFSALTSNYGASIELSKLAKSLNPKIIIIFGNDHFSALADRIMTNQSVIDYGFYGNDVVEGFSDFVSDYLSGGLMDLASHSGLVYRQQGKVKHFSLADFGRNEPGLTSGLMRNSEDASEYGRLPLVDYGLMDTIWPHRDQYLSGQQEVYFFMRNQDLRSQVIDIGRGCIKFAGERVADIPSNACDFCGIIPGQKAITTQGAERAWQILENAYNQGYNYFYITADELPLTMWGMLHKMAKNKPDWYQDLKEKPKMFGYARAEGFETHPHKIEVLVNDLGFNHFFIGFDGLSEISLRIMNKQSASPKHAKRDLVQQNLFALKSVVDRDCLVTAGLVVTHLGITKEIMDENYRLLEEIVSAHPRTFAALDFGALCPIPGSQSFRYLTNPETAEAKASQNGLRVNRSFLDSIKEKYRSNDIFDMNDMISDFIEGCCPDITPSFLEDHLSKITDLANRYNIVVGGGV
jgi:radical SAM superfamily enzyme YgiQ (UPF0313 family)